MKQYIIKIDGYIDQYKKGGITIHTEDYVTYEWFIDAYDKANQ